jgi:hypothetical protein
MSGELCPIGAKLGTDVLSLANRLLKNPITGMAVCCARAASGDNTAAPPRGHWSREIRALKPVAKIQASLFKLMHGGALASSQQAVACVIMK